MLVLGSGHGSNARCTRDTDLTLVKLPSSLSIQCVHLPVLRTRQLYTYGTWLGRFWCKLCVFTCM